MWPLRQPLFCEAKGRDSNISNSNSTISKTKVRVYSILSEGAKINLIFTKELRTLGGGLVLDSPPKMASAGNHFDFDFLMFLFF